MEVECAFFIQNDSDFKNHYVCSVKCQQIIDNVEIIFIGEHMEGKTNEDVTGIWFWYCNLTKIPQRLTKFFPNLQFLSVFSTNLKNLTKNDFIEYKNFERFDLNYNQIKFLPNDLFEGFKNLKKVTFRGNNLEFIEPDIFDGLDNLREINLKENTNYDLFSSFDDETSLCYEEVKAQLFEKFVLAVPEYLKNFVQKFNQKFFDLKNFTQILIIENQELKNSLSKQDEFSTFGQNKIFNLEKFLVNDKNFRDFRIRIEDREFHVHKFLLAARSPKLGETLQKYPEMEYLTLVDISVEIFEKILKFLYTDELPFEDGANILHIFAAAGQLKIEELKNFAAQKIYDMIDGENALEFLNLSNKYDHNGLRQKSFNEIKKKYLEIKFKDEWATDTENVIKIIDYVEEKKRVLKEIDEGIYNLLK